jgi:ABC-type sugar transport system ATPase subunit
MVVIMSLPILQIEGLDKSYPGVHALDNVDFDLYEGEVHALVGENGAGKSTFMKILDGSVTKDKGKIFINGKEVLISSPAIAQKLGVAMVYQELSLLPDLSVAENIFMGRWPKKKVFKTVDWTKIFEESKEILNRMGLKNINLKEKVANLGMGERQMIEIAKALSSNVKILLLDEPTSALSDEEIAQLFSLVKMLKDKGVGIIYVSHRLGELKQICDRITILRDGKIIGTLPMDKYEEKTLIKMMVGREISNRFPKYEIKRGEEVLKVKDLSIKGRFSNVNLTLYKGEILGIFGLMGAGRTELIRSIFALDKIDKGEIFIEGKRVRISSPREAIERGIGYLTEDRHNGLIMLMNVPQNITLASLRKFIRFGLLDHRLENNTAKDFIKDLNIRVVSENQKVGLLSGGNQQKVALAKLLCSKSKAMILDEPTRGIDVGAKVEVYGLMNEFAKNGSGILLISSEIPEVLNLSDRILVMNNGSFTAEFKRGEATEEELLKYALCKVDKN